MNAPLAIRRTILFICMAVVALVWIVPIGFLILISMKTSPDYFQSELWQLPKTFALLKNIKFVWVKTHLGIPVINSIGYALSGASFAILISSLAAYAITKLKIKGAFFFFVLLWSGMIFPIHIYLIPLYKAYH